MKEINMWEVSKSDGKLFREKIAGWQEHYMEKLAQDYTALLTDESKPASASSVSFHSFPAVFFQKHFYFLCVISFIKMYQQFFELRHVH